MQQHDAVTVHIPVVGSRPDYGGPHLEGAPALRRYRFWARGPSRDDPHGASLIPFGIHDSETCRWLQAASGLLHDAALGRDRAAQDADMLVVNVTTRDPPGVEGRSGMLGAACGEAAARWLRPGTGALLPVLAATGEIVAADEEVAYAGEALLVRPVEGVAAKLAGVAAMIAAEPAMLRGRGMVVVLPAANLQGGSDVAGIHRELVALENFCAQAALNVRVVRARTLADALAAWCPRDAWISIKVATQLAGAGPASAGPGTASPGRKRFAVIGAVGVFAALSIGVTADQGRPIVTLAPLSLPFRVDKKIQSQVAAALPALDLSPDDVIEPHSQLVELDGKVTGTFVYGRAAEMHSRGHKNSCYVAMALPGAALELLVTVGRGPWADHSCHGFEGIGLLPPRPPAAIRIGVIHHSEVMNPPPNTPEPRDPVVLEWTMARHLQIDVGASQRASDAEAKTIAAMRVLQ